MKVLWLTDLHLDQVDEKCRKAFYKRLNSEDADAMVITGDISNARYLPSHLKELGRACGSRAIYFVLGNHDFYGSSFTEVDQAVASVCQKQKNLHHLGQGEVIGLGDNVALVGHRGWADGLAGWGNGSGIRNPDSDGIEDLRSQSEKAVFDKMKTLGRASGRYFRDVLPYALTCYQNVLVATHFPPFTQAVFYNGKPCGRHHLPHYANLSAGCAIGGIARYFPKNRITVLCGHTHSAADEVVSEQIRILAGEAKPGRLQVQQVFDVSRTLLSNSLVCT